MIVLNNSLRAQFSKSNLKISLKQKQLTFATQRENKFVTTQKSTPEVAPQFLHNAGMQTGTRRTMALYRRMLFQHPHNNGNDADRRQTAYLTHNAKKPLCKHKNCFPVTTQVSASRPAHSPLNGAQWICMLLSIVLNVWQAPSQKSSNENSPKQKQLSLRLNGKNH